jgi:hypothetical protein
MQVSDYRWAAADSYVVDFTPSIACSILAHGKLAALYRESNASSDYEMK